MEVLVPIEVTDTVLKSSSVAEDPTPAWVAGTYAIGYQCHLVSTHRVYERTVATASAVAPNLDPTGWKDLHATNRWAMFDQAMDTVTRANNTLTVVLQPGYHNALAILGIEGGSLLHVVERDAPGGNIVREYSDNLEESQPADWWEYYFMPFKPRTGVLVADIEPFYNAEVTVTLSGQGVVGIAMLAVGDLRPLGDTTFDSEAIPVDYSYVDIDAYGNNTILKGKTAKDLAVTVEFDAREANRVTDTVHELLGRPCLWVSNRRDQYRYLWSFGLGSGKVRPKDAKTCVLPLQVKGLI